MPMAEIPRAAMKATLRPLSATDIGHPVAGRETGAAHEFLGNRAAAGAERLTLAVAHQPATEKAGTSRCGRGGRCVIAEAVHHLSSSACSTFSMRPAASSSET